MQSCHGRLGSDRVWSMFQDQTVCLKVGQPVSKFGRSAHWYSWQKMREHACNLVTGVLGVILCGVCLKIRQYVSKLDSLSQSQTFWLTDCLDTRLNTALPALTSWHVPWFFYVHKPHLASVDLPTVCSFGDRYIWQSLCDCPMSARVACLGLRPI